MYYHCHKDQTKPKVLLIKQVATFSNFGAPMLILAQVIAIMMQSASNKAHLGSDKSLLLRIDT